LNKPRITGIPSVGTMPNSRLLSAIRKKHGNVVMHQTLNVNAMVLYGLVLVIDLIMEKLSQNGKSSDYLPCLRRLVLTQELQPCVTVLHLVKTHSQVNLKPAGVKTDHFMSQMVVVKMERTVCVMVISSSVLRSIRIRRNLISKKSSNNHLYLPLLRRDKLVLNVKRNLSTELIHMMMVKNLVGVIKRRNTSLRNKF